MIRRVRGPARGAGLRARRRAGLEEVHALAATPLISIVMPVYETEPRHLREAIQSVRRQQYPAWELCIVDDGSQSRSLRRTIERQASRDDRIKFVFSERNAGISAATNTGFALAGGEYVGFLDHDDVLTDDALLAVAQALSADPGLDVVYSDSDKLTAHGRRADPFFKPDWSPVYALGAMYIGHLLVVRRSLAAQVGGFDSAYDKIQDFEFMLRVSESTDRIHHIPRILYHWRAIPGSIAAGTEQKSGVPELQARAVSEHMRRVGVAAAAIPHPQIAHRAMLAPNGAPAAADPKVSIVVTRRGSGQDLARTLRSLLERTTHPRFELSVVTGAGAAPVPDLGHPVEVIEDSSPEISRARAANLGASRATGDYLLFLSDAIEVTEPDWLGQALLHAGLPGVGAVGPLLVSPDGRAQTAGVAIGLDAPAVPILSGTPGDADGYYGAMACAREVSAIRGECMLVRADAFGELGGFNEAYATEYDDYDFCQRLRSRGMSVVYTPRPRMVTHETPSERSARTDVVDRALFVDCWYDELERGDPYFNPNFSRNDADYRVAG